MKLALAETAPEVYKLELEDEEGRRFIGRLEGKRIVENLYQREDDGKLIWYDDNRLRYFEVEDPEETLRELLCGECYLEAMHSLGITPEVDI